MQLKHKLYACMAISVFAVCCTIAFNSVKASNTVGDGVFLRNDKLVIPINCKENSEYIITGYNSKKEIIAVNSHKTAKVTNTEIVVDMIRDLDYLACYEYRPTGEIKKIASATMDQINCCQMNSESEFYVECDIPIHHIGNLKMGSYDENGLFRESDLGYSSDIINTGNSMISVEVNYHLYKLNILTKDSHGAYKIKNIDANTYSFKENDCAFTVVKSDGSELTENDINTIRQRILVSTDVNIENNSSNEKSHFTKPFTLWGTTEKINNYEAWPYGNCWYDENDNTVNLVYSASSDHLSYIGKSAVYFRKIYENNNVSVATPVAVDKEYGYIMETALKLSDGSYGVYIKNKDEEALYLYKSIDQGNTWVSNKVNIALGDSITGVTLMPNNKLIGLLRTKNKTVKIVESYNGTDWSVVSGELNKNQYPLEGTFVQLSNNRVICIMRGALGQMPYRPESATYMVKSNDNGKTWSELIELEGIDASYNPVAALYHDEDKTVELLYGSRYAREDYCGSINHTIISEDDLWNADFSNTEEERLYKAPSSRDFGYFAMAETKSGAIKAFFYSGRDGYANIYCMIKPGR